MYTKIIQLSTKNAIVLAGFIVTLFFIGQVVIRLSIVKAPLPQPQSLEFKLLVYVNWLFIMISFMLPLVISLPNLVISSLLLLSSFALLYWSYSSLRNNYSLGINPREDEHEIVQDGPYSIVRNPIYLSYLLGFGAVIPLSLIYGFLAWIILIVPLYVVRLIREEKRLEEKYGEEYIKYKKKTYRLIPFLF